VAALSWTFFFLGGGRNFTGGRGPPAPWSKASGSSQRSKVQTRFHLSFNISSQYQCKWSCKLYVLNWVTFNQLLWVWVFNVNYQHIDRSCRPRFTASRHYPILGNGTGRFSTSTAASSRPLLQSFPAGERGPEKWFSSFQCFTRYWPRRRYTFLHLFYVIAINTTLKGQSVHSVVQKMRADPLHSVLFPPGNRCQK